MRFVTRTIAVVAAVALCGGALALAAGRPAHPAGAGGQKWQPGQGWDHFLAMFDTDKDGKVSKAEMLAKAPLFDHLDTNKDGVVTKEEVQALPASQKHPQAAGFLQKFDANNDNKVTREEWNNKRAEGFDAADTNHDGFVDKDEFTAGAKELSGSM